MKDWAEAISTIARAAGEQIMAVYAQDFEVSEKADSSPLTKADLAAHRCIVSRLPDLDGDLPILSEESAAMAWQERRTWSRYWLVDPLDGTREFIKKIALI